MAINLDPRAETLPGIWAKNSAPVQPQIPIKGHYYREPNISRELFELGQAYAVKVPANIWNQMFYLFSYLLKDTEQYGFIRWSPLVDYTEGAKVTSMNGTEYRAIQPSGPGTAAGARNPMTEDRYWQTFKEYITASGEGVGGLIPVGFIGLLPFRGNNLPYGWYLCNGEIYTPTTAPAIALSSLPSEFRADWGITVNSSGASMPNLFVNGKGVFLRAIDGTTRLPGSIEQDGARAVSGSVSSSGSINAGGSSDAGTFGGIYRRRSTGDTIAPTGAFSNQSSSSMEIMADGRNEYWDCNTIRMSKSNLFSGATLNINSDLTLTQQNQADENRPINMGMTPAIYLGA